MTWYLATPTHWIRCEIVSEVLGLATVRLYNELRTRAGRKRKCGDGWLIEPKV